MEPLPIPLIKETYNGKSYEYFVKQKLCRDPTSSTSDIFDFNMSLFDYGDPEGFYCLYVNSI